ncbi:uncharacterized protein LOC119729107 [Patiria miniata]|uniref:Uncharacterized protein n=1 Tax=Patiria miniata TaxID=46514 RepID=A0A914A145_PATMI|nr:uncharacterized protein LOC119729107 [Patiria miniata]XP_038057552.1 uncharacterized protein LOC119729107 [Patiria miniata]
MSAVNNKGTQYDPPQASSCTDEPESAAKGKDNVDLVGISSDEEPPILPPRVSITPRSGLKSRSTNRHRRSCQRRSGAIDELQINAERTSGSTGTISSDTKKPSENTGKLSARTDKPSPNSGRLSKVIGNHTRKDHEAAPVAWTAEYRSKLSEEDRMMRLQITAQNSHPECLKPATAAGLTRRLTIGNYLPKLSSVQFVVKNEVNFWPSAKGGTDEGVGRSRERVTYSRHAVRGTGVHSARLRTDEERRRSNLTPRLPPARKGAIVTNRVFLVSRSSNRSVQGVSNPIRPASEPARLHRHEASAPSAKHARLQRCSVSKEDLSKPIERVATANRNHPRPPPSDASVPTPSEYEEATGKVRAWITHRERENESQPNPEMTTERSPRISWNTGMSPVQRDLMLPLRKAHPLVRSTLTVGNFMTDGTTSKGVSARVAALRMDGNRRQIGVPF